VSRTDERPGSKTSRVSELEAQVASLTERATAAETALANLHKAYRKALEELQILHRRLHLARAERADGLADQLAFDSMFAKVEQLAKQLDAATGSAGGDGGGSNKKNQKSTGRRDLAETDLPVVRVEVLDPELEGKATRVGFEETSHLGYERGGPRRVVVARAVLQGRARCSADAVG
jgi:hypothetical protein